MNKQTIIVYDLETGGLDWEKVGIVSIGAIAVHPRTLEVVKNDQGEPEEFYSLSQPPSDDAIEDAALAVNKLTREQIAQATPEKQVWNEFVKFVNRFNPTGKIWDAPVPAGYNIDGYDKYFIEKLCKRHKTKVLFGRGSFDVLSMCRWWMENRSEIQKYNLDYFRQYFGMGEASLAGGHNSIADCRDTLAILRKFLNMTRRLNPKFKDCFKQQETVVG